MRCPAPFFLLPALAACGSGPVAGRDTAKTDTAVATALARPIMVDARMRGDSNSDALAPPERPIQAIGLLGEDTDPATSAPTLMTRTVARAAHTGGAFAGCDWQVRYSFGWAARIASDVPLPDDARTLEAAGSDRAGCALRVVRFATGASSDAAINRYRALATRGGFVVRALEGDRSGLIAVRRRDGAALVVTATARSTGSAVELLVNRGN